MSIKQYDIWIANLNPVKGTEPGKIRPVVIIQTDSLNNVHQSTIICPITTNTHPESELLRVHLKENQLDHSSDVLVDQIRAIDNKRLIKKVGKLSKVQVEKLKMNIALILDI